jgi:hypothetical protein
LSNCIEVGSIRRVLALVVERPLRRSVPLLSVASADDDGVVVGGDVLRAESGPADR